MVVDALLDEQGQTKPGTPYCGWWGNIKSTDLLPFVVKQIDEAYFLDFGSDEDTDQEERYHLFNLFYGPVAVGKKFKLSYFGNWYSFTVKTVADMLNAKPIE